VWILPIDCFCGLVVIVPGYRSKGLGSISGPTRFSGTGSTQPRDYNWGAIERKWVNMHICITAPLCAFFTTIFYFIFSFYLSSTEPHVRCLYGCCYMTWVVQWFKLALSKGPNRIGVSFPSSEDGYYNSGRWAESRDPVILSVMQHCQNLTDCISYLCI
jgi:hypothetical protein